MIVEYINGCAVDAFLSKHVNVFAHGANCQNKMKSGIARDVKAKLPELYDADQRTTKGDSSKLGSFSMRVFDNNHVGFNLYTQFMYGTDRRHLNYAALSTSLAAMKQELQEACTLNSGAGETRWARYLHLPPEETIVGIPKIGCGLAGGDWSIVEEMVNFHLPDYPVVVFYI